MCTPCVHHEEPMSLDVIPNPNSNLDCSRLYHMTSRSCAYLLSLFRCRLIIIILNPNPSPSLSTHSSYNSIPSSRFLLRKNTLVFFCYISISSRIHFLFLPLVFLVSLPQPLVSSSLSLLLSP